jgi:hypothetical protein
LGIRDQITSTVFMGTGDFSWQRRILRAADSQSSIFAGSGTSRLKKCSFSKRSPLPLFKDSGIRVGFADHGFVAGGSWEAGWHQLRATRKWLAP